MSLKNLFTITKQAIKKLMWKSNEPGACTGLTSPIKLFLLNLWIYTWRTFHPPPAVSNKKVFAMKIKITIPRIGQGRQILMSIPMILPKKPTTATVTEESPDRPNTSNSYINTTYPYSVYLDDTVSTRSSAVVLVPLTSGSIISCHFRHLPRIAWTNNHDPIISSPYTPCYACTRDYIIMTTTRERYFYDAFCTLPLMLVWWKEQEQTHIPEWQ